MTAVKPHCKFSCRDLDSLIVFIYLRKGRPNGVVLFFVLGCSLLYRVSCQAMLYIFLKIRIFTNKQKRMYERFRQCFKDDPVISVSEISKAFPGFDTRNLINWQRKGYLIRLRNGFYTFRGHTVEERDLFVLANRLYGPSYVSLETALSWHGIIPEGVYSVESVATRKTSSFKTPLASFNYRKIKPELYFGYDLIASGRGVFRLATPEKAILDYFYLNTNVRSKGDLQALRWNTFRLASLDYDKLQAFARLFNAPSIHAKLDLLIDIGNVER